MTEFFHTLSYVILPLMLAVVLHEYAHGWVAHYFGDDTAKSLGRLTLNPMAHIDLWGTILIPMLLIFSSVGFIFGYAKPVPVTPGRLHNPRRDMALVAAAGPAMNFVLVVGSALLLGLLHLIDPTLKASWPPQPGIEPRQDLLGMFLLPLAAMALFSIIINTVIMTFNLLPIPPLDGGRILLSLLPLKPALALSKLEPYGMFILLGLFMLDSRVPLISTFVGTALRMSLTLFVIDS